MEDKWVGESECFLTVLLSPGGIPDSWAPASQSSAALSWTTSGAWRPQALSFLLPPPHCQLLTSIRQCFEAKANIIFKKVSVCHAITGPWPLYWNSFFFKCSYWSCREKSPLSLHKPLFQNQSRPQILGETFLDRLRVWDPSLLSALRELTGYTFICYSLWASLFFMWARLLFPEKLVAFCLILGDI